MRLIQKCCDLPVKWYIPDAYLAVVASPEAMDGTQLLLEPNSNPIAKAYQQALFDAGIPVIVFSTDDIYKEHEKLKNKGVVFRKEPATTDWGTDTLLEDGFGNLIQLFQP
jgi:hypothetical protein